MRPCSGCTLCCHVFSVMSKPEYQNCQFQNGDGCKIHNTSDLPKYCKLFQCWWTRGKLPWEEKPSDTGLVIFDAPVGEISKAIKKKFGLGYIEIMAQSKNCFLDENNAKRIDQIVENNLVVLIYRNERRLVGNPNAAQWLVSHVQHG